MQKRKIFGLVLLLLFIVGNIIIPVFHKSHCADNYAAHETDDCPICQCVNAPIIAGCLVTAPEAKSVAVDNLDIHEIIVSAFSLFDFARSRAPPGC